MSSPVTSSGIAASSAESALPSSQETAWRWFADPFALLDERAATHGDRFTLDFARFGRHLIVSAPDDVRAVFAADTDTLRAGRGNRLLEPILGPSSLLLLDGERHADRRGLLLPAFRADRSPAFARTIVGAALRHTDAWHAGATVSLQRAALAISREVILRVALGLRDDEAIDELMARVEGLMALVATNAPFDDDAREGRMRTRLLAARASLAEELKKAIRGRAQSASDGDDVLSLLLARAANPTLPIDEDEILDHLITMILAGHETTATSITWTLLAILSHADVRGRLVNEIDAVAGEDPERLAGLPYLQATCLESLRHFPVVPVVSREVARPFLLGDELLPAGINVTPCAYLAHRRPESFANPTAFEPERFLGRRPPPHLYFPFGGGERRCLGMGFAFLEMQLVVGSLVDRFSLALLDDRPPRPVRRAVTIAPSGGTHVRVEVRKPERVRSTGVLR